MEINFYQIDDVLYKSIAGLLVKIIEDKKKALIYSTNLDLINQINEGLWSFSKTKFLPHASFNDNQNPERQPIFITNQEENSNKANFLIMLEKTDDNFLNNFEKIFYFFDDSNLKESKQLWRYYKKQNINLNFFKKIDGKWINTT